MVEMDKKTRKTSKCKRDKRGRLLPGNTANPNGRPKNAEADELRKALMKAKVEKDKSLLEHFIERAYENDQVLVAAMKKLLPDKKAVEAAIDQNKPFVLVFKHKKDKAGG